MKKLFLTMLIVGSCAFANAQEVASPEPSVQAVVGYADEINIRGLSYGGDGILAGANAKIPTKWVDLYAGGYHLLASEEETQSHFAAGAKKAWNVADIAFSTTAGISSHQINNPNIDSTAAVSLKIGIDNDPTGISKWINPSLSLWKDVDYGFTGTTWSVNHTWSVNALDKDWSLTPSFDLGLGDDYDYEQLSLKVSTDLNVLGVDIEPSLKLTYLDNDVDVDSLKADSQTSVWAGFTYKF
jgi:hypothetical protein|tara:strand:+ start:352 stop:1074 length:723 start_codon:yes stop_codon:yes gene_type:complete